MDCPTRLDHGVVVVGLVKAGSDGDDGGDGGDNSDATHTVSCRDANSAETRSRPG